MTDLDWKRERWNRIRKKGEKRFVLFHGVLPWGVFGSLINYLLRSIFIPDSLNYNTFGTIGWLLTNVFGYGLIGYAVARKIWSRNEDNINKSI